MTTMTISEAEHILDIVRVAFLEESHRLYHPMSTLQGYGVFQIDIAVKLRIANDFLLLAEQNDFEEQFAKRIKLYDSIPLQIVTLFVEDEKLDELKQLSKRLPADSHEYRRREREISPSPFDSSTKTLKDVRLAALETPSSFGDYCQSIGAKDSIYWQKIYTRIRLEYTPASPRGNEPIFADGN